MADKSVRVVLTANAAGFLAEVRRAGAAVDAFNKNLGKASTTPAFRDATRGLAVVGVALAGVALAAVKMSADFDKSMSAVSATGGEAKAAYDELRTAALDAGQATRFSATEAAGGIEALLKAGVSAKDVLAGGLDGALALAASGNLDVAASAETAATAMVQFGLSGKDVGHVADLLAAGAGKAQGEVSDLAAALKQSGLVAAAAGLSIEETTGTLSAFAAAGLLGSDAGTSLKTMLQRLQNPSKEAASTMKTLGINAYDASGKFVTMESLAGQLQAKLGGLSEEQRNAALATIFGSDAVRAANVLYSEGAAGIADWTTKVNDTGFAARTAAEKNNNLMGSLEELRGSFEGLMIAAGSSSQGPLRELVKSLTDLTNWAARNQGAAQAIVAVAGGLGALALTAAGVMKAVTAINEFKVAAEALKVGPGLAGAAAFAGVTIAALALAKALDSQTKPALTSSSDAIVALARAAAGSGDLNAFFKEVDAFGKDADGIDNLAGAFDRLFNKTDGRKFNDFFSDGVHALTGIRGQTDYTVEAFGRLDKAISGLDGAAAAEMFGKIAATAKEQGVSVEQLASLFPEYSAKLQAAAAAQGEGVTSAEALARATDTEAEAARAAAQAHSANAAAILAEAGTALGVSGSLIALEASYDAATETIAENGKTLDLNTDAGRENQSALDAIAAAALRTVDAYKANGSSADEAAGATQRARDAFIGAATSAGMAQDAAEALADKYGLIPEVVKTDMIATAQTAAAEAALNNAARDRYATIYLSERIASGSLGGMTQADGGVVSYYGRGGLREKHVAQIAPAGAWRVWAEPETGGEAYIPLSRAKRDRSLDIWRQTGRLLGVQGFASGGFHAQPQTVASASGVSASDIRAALNGMSVDIDNGRLFFRRELAAATGQAGRTARRSTL